MMNNSSFDGSSFDDSIVQYPCKIEAVTFDFFNTLIYHREGRGRGSVLMEYLEGQGFKPAPWEHTVLYEIFEDHDRHYSPQATAAEKDEYRVLLARRVFRALRVTTSSENAPRHASALWQILGPAAFAVFPDVGRTLEALISKGYPLALISNWQRGLRHFCTELNLSEYFDHILGSADVGVAKPDVRIFAEACERLGVPPGRVLHVGDSLEDDYAGAKAAGLLAVLVDRDAEADPGVPRVIRGLDDVTRLLCGAVT